MSERELGNVLDALIDHRGKTVKKLGGDFSDDGVPVVSAVNIKNGRIDFSQRPRFVSQDLFKKWMPIPLKKHDVVLTSEAPLGEVALVPSDDPLVLGQRLFALRGKQGILDSRFLYYLFRWGPVQDQLNARSTGTTVVGIRQAELVKIRIPDTPFADQQSIADVLGSLDDKIGVNREMSEALDSLATAMFDEMISEFAAPDTRPLMSRTEILSGGTPKTSIGSYWNGQIPWVSVVDLSPGPWVVATEKCITQEAVVNSAASPLPEKTVVISARGTVGRIAMTSREMAINQSCYGLLDIDGYQYYLLQLLRRAVPELRTGAHGSIFDTITRRSFESLMVAALPVSALQSFEHRVTPLYELILANEREIATLTAIRDCLLPGLLCGEISVREAETIAEGAV